MGVMTSSHAGNGGVCKSSQQGVWLTGVNKYGHFLAIFLDISRKSMILSTSIASRPCRLDVMLFFLFESQELSFLNRRAF